MTEQRLTGVFHVHGELLLGILNGTHGIAFGLALIRLGFGAALGVAGLFCAALRRVVRRHRPVSDGVGLRAYAGAGFPVLAHLA